MFFSQPEMFLLQKISLGNFKAFTVQCSRLPGNRGSGGKAEDASRTSPCKTDCPISEAYVVVDGPAHIDQKSGPTRMQPEESSSSLLTILHRFIFQMYANL